MKKQYLATFVNYLKDNEGRYTSQKEVIATEVYRTRTHFEVVNFIDKLRAKKDGKISRATVYRTIKQLLEAGLIQKISTQDGKVYYERTPDHQQHDHLICNVCGKIFEMLDEEVTQKLDAVCQAMGFSPEYRSLHIYGKCKKCQKAKA